MSNKRQNNQWIQTLTGRRFYPLDPRPEEIDINDIAHALSQQCRFGGHSLHFYSVAQHSVLVSLLCDPKDALHGLLHDASEAYLVDVPRPLKKTPAFDAYRTAEKKLMNVICDVFGLSHDEPASVKLADERILVTESRDLMMNEGRGWHTQVEPYDFHIEPWSPEHAKIRFTSRLHELTWRRK